MNYDAPSEIRNILETHGLTLKKRWGQNFLINRGAREKLAALLDIQKGDLVWEIGPGLGAMTELLLARAQKLVVFEIDRGLIRLLKDFFGGRPNLAVCEGDAVKNLAAARREHGSPARVLGNLPYASASQIIAAFIDADILPDKTVITVQRELADRMTAGPGTKAYSSFSLLCQSAFRITTEMALKAGSFFPEPGVASTVVSLVPRRRLADRDERDCFQKLVRTVFASRRKTLRNNLIQSHQFGVEEKRLIRERLAALGINEQSRAEELDLEIYLDIAQKLAGQGGSDGQ